MSGIPQIKGIINRNHLPVIHNRLNECRGDQYTQYILYEGCIDKGIY